MMRMRKYEVAFLALVALFCGCQPKAAENTISDPADDGSVAASEVRTLSPELGSWVSAVQKRTTSAIQDVYTDDAVLVVSDDEVINGPSKIADFYTSTDEQIVTVQPLFEVVANEQRGISYQLVSLKTDSLAEYVQFTIWEKDGARIVKALEFIEQGGAAASVADELDERRQLWMTHCNAHDVPSLVTELYTPDALYFNHRPLVKGRDSLIREYGYMGNVDYHLTLQPLHIEQVKADCVIEIGQCQGSYGGKYVLVWMKAPDGKWQIFLDSNV